MQFTKLRLHGFKSFVDPTDLLIMEGLTGVVGPNGCGKSNLLEAFRWVMGENRPSQMRGGGMEDVIFAGSESRAAKHFAEVTLIVDNKERHAPAAFNQSDELEVIRRITRDLGSAYRLNGKEIRARDVAMMFADAATGSHSPSLVRQGQISELINAKPQARRRVLEDAAGISGLYQRRHEAELKLGSAETNLLRVDDTIEQLSAQIRSLERQAKAAQRYKEIAADLRNAEAIFAYLEWKALAEKHLELERLVTGERLTRSGAERACRDFEMKLKSAQDALPALRDEEAIAAALLQRLNIALAALSDEETRALQTIEDLRRASTNLERDKSREEQIAQDAAEALSQLTWEEGHLTDATSGEETEIMKAAGEATIAHEVLTKSEEILDDLRQELAREEARASAADRRINDAISQQRKAEENLAKLKSEIAETEHALSLAKFELEEKQNALAQSESNVTIHLKEAQNAETERVGKQSQYDRLRAELAEIQGELTALNAEQKGLVAALAKGAEGNPLIDKVTVEQGYEKAFGAALNNELEAPVSEEGSGWRFTGLAEDESWPDDVMSISSFIQAPEILQKRLAFIGITKEVTPELHKMLKPGQRLVSHEGDLYRWDGFVKLAKDGATAAAIRLQQRNRLNELERIIATKGDQSSDISGQLQDVKTKLDQARQDFETAQQMARQAERQQTEALRLHHLTENNLERLSSRNEINMTTERRFEAELAEVRNELEEAEKSRVDQVLLEEKKFTLETKRTDVEDARSDMLSKRARLDDLRKDRERRQLRLRDIQREKENWQKRLDHTINHQSDLASRIAENQSAQKDAEAKPAQLSQKRLLLESDLSNANHRLNRAKDALAAGESARATADQAHRSAESELANIREKLARLEAEHEALASERDKSASQIYENYDRNPEVLGGELLTRIETLPSRETVLEEIQKLIRQRENLGAVNLRAEEDREEVTLELEKLVSDKSEITEAIARLRQAISELNREGRERLLAAFSEVNENFSALFTKLFGGGSAKLELVESDDPLNAGLEIMCQPPGKKLATLSLLSGGEQTLTALSLIFAVFLTNPSPICVLDEVDAPLDDANVTRFCNLLDEMVSQTDTRFLIITHHALTMSRMHRLFGVTMRERGVSQLVSVDLTQAEKLVEN